MALATTHAAPRARFEVGAAPAQVTQAATAVDATAAFIRTLSIGFPMVAVDRYRREPRAYRRRRRPVPRRFCEERVRPSAEDACSHCWDDEEEAEAVADAERLLFLRQLVTRRL